MIRPLLALVAVAAILPQVVVLAAGIHLRNSQDAVAAGNASRAGSEALAAKAVEPWAATPYLQLGLVSEAETNYADASHWLNLAIKRSSDNWYLWYIAARIDTKRGAIDLAKRDLDESRRLDPRFSGAAVKGASRARAVKWRASRADATVSGPIRACPGRPHWRSPV